MMRAGFYRSIEYLPLETTPIFGLNQREKGCEAAKTVVAIFEFENFANRFSRYMRKGCAEALSHLVPTQYACAPNAHKERVYWEHLTQSGRKEIVRATQQSQWRLAGSAAEG